MLHNAGYTHPLIPFAREEDKNNYQPRASFSYDVKGDGTSVLRGGAGKFTGRFLLVPDPASPGTSASVTTTTATARTPIVAPASAATR